MKIQVLGSGCPKCAQLNKVVVAIVEQLGLDAKVEYLKGPEGTQKIIELGVMKSPVLAINDQVALVGFTDDKKKLTEIISQHLEDK